MIIRNSTFGGEDGDENTSESDGGAVAVQTFNPLDVAGSTCDGDGSARSDIGADEAPAQAPAQPGQPAAPTPAAGGVLGTQARSCVSRRSFKIRLRNRGHKVHKATVIVNGKRVKVLRGKRLTSRVNLRGLPKGRFKVRITVTLADGRKVSSTRSYRTCAKRPSTPKKKGVRL